MTITSAKMFSREMKTTIINIYSYKNRTLCGTISNPFLKEVLYFENVMQFLLLIENLLDSIGFPQKAMDLRNGAEKKNAAIAPAAGAAQKAIATFELEVIFRQNASWQGCLTSVEKNVGYSFRSVLELLFLMDDLLGQV